MGERPEFVKREMVDWYHPKELLRTAWKVSISSLLGKQIDTRRLVNLEHGEGEPVHDRRDAKGFDYMADTGDGYASTYTMAYLLSSSALPVVERGGGKKEFPRGDFLILGGDEVYPDASKVNYTQRLIRPFERAWRALPDGKDLTDVFLIPGNHDWYDSLAAFAHRFLHQRPFAGFRTTQKRNYFVIELDHGWELWGIDIQLQDALDAGQYRFFKARAKTLSKGKRVILCAAKPIHVYGSATNDVPLHYLVGKIDGWIKDANAKMPLFIAGDVHNYQRYISKNAETQSAEERVEVVCGGGGAFLHPTHVPSGGGKLPPYIVQSGFVFPPKDRSYRLSHKLFGFAVLHKWMAVLIGALYALMFMGVDFETVQPLLFPLTYPGNALAVALVLGGCVAFSHKQGHGRRVVWGSLHGVVHIGLSLGLWLGAALWLAPKLAATPPTWLGAALAGWLPPVFVTLAGSALGGTIFGAYLWMALNCGHFHHNESFSALSHADDKCFLRCRFDANGALNVVVVGVDRVADDGEKHPVATHEVERFTVD